MFPDILQAQQLGIFQDVLLVQQPLGISQDVVQQRGIFRPDVVRHLGIFQDVIQQQGIYQYVFNSLEYSNIFLIWPHNYYRLFRVRSWNNGALCVFLCPYGSIPLCFTTYWGVETEIPHEISLKFDILVTYMHLEYGRGQGPMTPVRFAHNGGDLLTHWGRNKMAAIFQTTFSNG